MPPRKCACGSCPYCRTRDKNLRAVRKYRANNLEKEKTRQSLWYKTKGRLRQRQKQGIVDAHLADEVLALQGGVCAICGDSSGGGQYGAWNADHDHETGLLRGMLCDRHNRGLGYFNNNPELLLEAVYYLANPPAQKLREQKLREQKT